LTHEFDPAEIAGTLIQHVPQSDHPLAAYQVDNHFVTAREQIV
jgi:hypothetical protein